MSNCFKCGAELNDNYKCCINCGTLNPNHQDNKHVIKFSNINSINNNGNDMNSNTNYMNNTIGNNINSNTNHMNNTIGNDINSNTNYINNSINNEINTFNKKQDNVNKVMFIIINCIVFILILLALISSSLDEFTFSILIEHLPSSLLVTSVVYFYIICYQLLFIKAGLPWWGFFIPVYSSYLMYKLAFGSGVLFFISFVPIILMFLCIFMNIFWILEPLLIISNIINTVFPFLILFFLGKRFGRSGLLTIILGFIIIPTTALSKKYQYLD